MEGVNSFYSLYLDKSRQISEFELFDLGLETLSCISPSIYSNGHRDFGGEFIYRKTNQDDYDKEFYKKVLKIDPIYRVIDFLDFHFNNYCEKSDNKALFIKHIQYVILPMFEAVNYRKPFKDIIIKWIESKSKMNNKKRTAPTQALKKKLQAEINSKCPFCNNTDVETFEFHHVDQDRSNNVEKNLLMLCPTCHAKIDKG